MAFYGKVALVTGGASGMGKLSAQRLAATGAKVAILDMNEEGLASTEASAESIKAYKCDTSNLEEVRSVVAQVEADLGPIDRLVQAAAIMPAGLLTEMSAELINKQMLVNYCGTVNLVKTVMPAMQARHSGDIIIFGSMAGDVLTSHLGAYCATKSATNTFGEVLIKENRDKGLRILLVCPPMVATPLIEQSLVDDGFASLQDAHKSGRMSSPEFIIDEIEKALEKGKEIVRPGEAKYLVALRRFAPSLLWKIMLKANKD